MAEYNHKEIESHWRDSWVKDNVCAAHDFSEKPKKYILVEFPYPSGSGLHMGHFMRYTLPEVYSRKLRMSGYNVMFPIGWDAFGLPAENYAVQTGVHPAETTEKAINNFILSLQHAGFGIDWDRVVNTTDPDYYKWTQWIFLKFFEAGLAESKEMPVWWCEELRTVLANEEVLEDEEGNKISERGEHPVERRNLRQWNLKITEYAEKLINGLDTIDFPDSVKFAQRNWIGKSEGARIVFPVKSGSDYENSLEVFTTRPDTVYGVTFMVLAPEHPLVNEVLDTLANKDEVSAYCEKAKNKSDVDRQAFKDKSGVKLEGVYAEHPLFDSAKQISVYIADYVLKDYGTGAIMAVPAHDERDYEFATKYNIPITQTVFPREGDAELPYIAKDERIKTNSEILALLKNNEEQEFISCQEMTDAVVKALELKKLGGKEITYRLRDWIFSRQRYWGEPIPIIEKEDGSFKAIVNTKDDSAVDEKLPLELPDVPDYTPSADGTSPLAKNTDWVNITDEDGKPAKRETNTMPNWAGSCWYYLRYIDPSNSKCFADPEKMKYWLPVDRYFGGSEHTTLHLLYSRFWHQFLYDEGEVPTPEPYAWRMNGGILLGEDGVKQSKSRGNVVDLNSILEEYGADAVRLYICFLGPYDATMAWNSGGLKACKKLVNTIYQLRAKVSDQTEDPSLTKLYHHTAKRMGSMLDNLKMNTAVSEIMIFVNEAKKAKVIHTETWKGFVKLIAPFTVFLSEELWQEVNSHKTWDKANSVHIQDWPQYDPALLQQESVTVVVQVNGKKRATLDVAVDVSENSLKEEIVKVMEKTLYDVKLEDKFIIVKNPQDNSPKLVNVICK